MSINVHAKGNNAERAVARYLRDAGYPLAITSRNAMDGVKHGEDILGVPGVAIEVKNRRDLNIPAALAQTFIQAGPSRMPLLVVKPYGVGMMNVGEWWAISFFRDIVPLFPDGGDL